MIRFFDHGFGVFTPDRPIPPCRWDRFDLLCVHEGRLGLTFSKGRTAELESDAGVLIHPETRFEGAPPAGRCRISVQHFAIEPGVGQDALPVPLGRLVGRRDGVERVQLGSDGRTHEDIHRSIELAFARQTRRVRDLRVALLTLVLGELSRRPAASPRARRRWRELEAWLDGQLQRNVPVAEMARHAGLSEDHFRRRFREVFGEPPGRFLQRRRMREAQRLLRETDLPIKAIASRMGYRELANFYRAFRSSVGTTPAAYRERHAPRG